MDNAAIAANNEAGMMAARQNQSDQAGLQNKMATRGLQPGSGAEMGMAQQANQASYNTVAQSGAQNAANAQMRALQAINSSGRLAGDIASAD